MIQTNSRARAARRSVWSPANFEVKVETEMGWFEKTGGNAK